MQTLLRTMMPELQDGEFVFCTVAKSVFESLELTPLGLFCEQEGLTLILKREEAEEHHLDYIYVSRMITLTVHSSLDAVGFLATIMAKLAKHNISVNTVSAYYHDHLFVPVDRAHDAMRILHELSTEQNL